MKYLEEFRVDPGRKFKLDKIDPAFTDGHVDKASAQAETEAHAAKLRALQELLYAERKRALLIVLQAMDAGGKDGTVRHVLGTMNPQGCRVVAFKEPTRTELGHDFLWRIHAQAPALGEVAVFNRSHYEDVLVARVNKLVTKKMWSARYDQINAFESLLAASGTHILKFYLHISKAEQLRRFKARLDDPSKHWKLNMGDYAARESWDDYMEAFEDALSRCSTDDAPWFVIPADHKWFRNLAVSRIVVEYLERLPMALPPPPVDLEDIRRAYERARSS